MSETSVTIWLWWIGGGTVALTGLILAYWSMFHNRSRGKRRCPQCWYDMSYTDGNTCSECGKSQKREKKFFKTRRRLGWSYIAVLLMSIGSIGTQWPHIEEKGWRSLAPSSVLILALSELEVSTTQTGASAPWNFKSIPAATLTTKQSNFREILLSRAEHNALWQWQWDWLISSSLKGKPNKKPPSQTWFKHYGPFIRAAIVHGQFKSKERTTQLEKIAINVRITIRHAWLADEPICFLIDIDKWFYDEPVKIVIEGSDVRNSRQVFLYGSDANNTPRQKGWFKHQTKGDKVLSYTVTISRLQYELKADTTRYRLPLAEREQTSAIKILEDPDQLLKAYDSEEFTLWLKQNTMAVFRPTFPLIEFASWRDTAIAPVVLPESFVLAATVEILHNGESFGSAYAWWTPSVMSETANFTWFRLYPTGYLTSPVKEGYPWEAPTDDTWSVRVKGELGAVLNIWPREFDTYWRGEFTLPLRKPTY